MPPVLSILDRHPKYKEDFYKSKGKIHCIFCKCLITQQKKYNLDSHLNSNKHKKQKKIAESRKISQAYQNLTVLQTQINDKQEINIDLIKAFTKADIPLEKINKLKSFFQKYCIN
ncbi:35550_t:CDS:1, partial [Racocetra persica]